MRFKVKQVRSFTIEDPIDNTGFISLSLSSETPCLREFGNEILLHNQENIDMSRTMPNGLPLLINHDDSTLPIGRLKNVRLDPDTRKLRGDAYFSGREDAQNVRQDVIDGVVCDVSIGYKILDYKIERSTEKDVPNNFLVTRWLPCEGSLVGMAFDNNVGIGRSDDEELETEIAEEAGEDPVEEATETPAEEVAEETAEQVETPVEEQVETGLSEEVDEPGEVPSVVPDETVIEDINNEEEKEEKDEDKTRSLSVENRIVPKTELPSDEILALRSVALSQKIKSPEEIDSIIKRSNTIEEARRLLLTNSNTSSNIILIKENRNMNTNDILYRSLNAALRGNFANIDEYCLPMIQRSGQRNFTVDLFMTRANEMTSAAKGNNTIYEQNIGFLDILRARTAVLQAGARTRVGNGSLSYVRQKTSVAATLRAENPGATTTNTFSDFEKVSYLPKALTAKVYLTDELQKETLLDLQTILKSDMVKQFANAMDLYAINGNVSPVITGLLSAANVNPVRMIDTQGLCYNRDLASAALPTWATVNALKAAVDTKAVDLASCNFVVTPALLGVLETTAKLTNGSAIATENKINGYGVISTSNMPIATLNHSMIFGDFSNLEICLQGPTEFMIDTQSRFDEGITILTARQYFDIGVLQPSAFATCRNFLVA